MPLNMSRARDDTEPEICGILQQIIGRDMPWMLQLSRDIVLVHKGIRSV